MHLEYGRKSSSGAVRRIARIAVKSIGLLALIALAVESVLAAIVWYDRSQWTNFALPADTIVFTTDAATIASVQNDPQYHCMGSAWTRNSPAFVDRLLRLTADGQDRYDREGAVLFTCRLRTRGGTERLILVYTPDGDEVRAKGYKLPVLSVFPLRAAPPWGWFSSRTLPWYDRVTYYGGHVCQNDPSQCEIPLRSEGGPSLVRVRLTDDEKVWVNDGTGWVPQP